MRVQVRHLHDVAVAVIPLRVGVIRARNRRRDGRAMPPHGVVRLRPFVAVLIGRDRHLRVVVVIERNRMVARASTPRLLTRIPLDISAQVR